MISDVQFSQLSWPGKVCYMLGLYTLWQCRPVLIMKWRREELEKRANKAEHWLHLLQLERADNPNRKAKPPEGWTRATLVE